MNSTTYRFTLTLLALLLAPGLSLGGQLAYTFNGNATTFPFGTFTATFTVDTANVLDGPPTEFNTSFMTHVDSGYSKPEYLNAGIPDPHTFVGENLVSIDAISGDFTGLQSGEVGIGGGSIHVGGDLNQFFAFSAPGNFQVTGVGDWTITAVPEPASFILFGLGAAGVLLLARRRRIA